MNPTKIIKLISHGKYDTATAEGRSNERLRRIALTSAAAALSKVLSMLIPLITVRITFNYLGQETYGLWNTVTSFFAMFTFADLGLGNGLQTQLGQASGREDTKVCVTIISSAYSMLTMVSIVLMAAFLILYPFVNWAGIMNAKSEQAVAMAGSVVLAIVSTKILSVPLSLVQRTQMALQDGFNSYLWQCVASICSLISVCIVVGLKLSPLTMIWVSSMITVVIASLNMAVYFRFQNRAMAPHVRNIDHKVTKTLMRTGIGFLILSVLTSIGLSLDNFIVAKAISLEDAATYSILYKIVYLIGAICTMISAPLWGANSEALAHGDLDWVRKTTKKMSRLAFGLSAFATLVITCFIKLGVKILLGKSLEFSILLVLGMCVMQIVVSVASPYFMVLNSAGKVRIQLLLFAIYTPISFILKFIAAKYFGAVAISWVGSICYTIFIVPWVFINAYKVLEC